MTSKEKRQLRNKISARSFRNEYITTLETDIAERDRLLDAIRSKLGNRPSSSPSQSPSAAAHSASLLTPVSPLSSAAGTSLRGTDVNSNSTAVVMVDDLRLPPPAPLPERSAAEELAARAAAAELLASSYSSPSLPQFPPNPKHPQRPTTSPQLGGASFWGGVSQACFGAAGYSSLLDLGCTSHATMDKDGLSTPSSSPTSSPCSNSFTGFSSSFRILRVRLLNNSSLLLPRGCHRLLPPRSRRRRQQQRGIHKEFQREFSPTHQVAPSSYSSHHSPNFPYNNLAFPLTNNNNNNTNNGYAHSQLNGLALSLKPAYFVNSNKPDLPTTMGSGAGAAGAGAGAGRQGMSSTLGALLTGKHHAPFVSEFGREETTTKWNDSLHDECKRFHVVGDSITSKKGKVRSSSSQLLVSMFPLLSLRLRVWTSSVSTAMKCMNLFRFRRVQKQRAIGGATLSFKCSQGNMKSLAASALFALPALGAIVSTRAPHASVNVVNAQGAPENSDHCQWNLSWSHHCRVATKGDTLAVTESTTCFMRRSTSMDFDGVSVNTDNAFNKYTLPLGEQTGTFWYHSQLSVQYVEGLRGALIIYERYNSYWSISVFILTDPDDPQKDLYDVDDESTIIQVGDWWHNNSTSLLAGYVATGIVPVLDSGVGRFQGGPEVPFNVVQGKRYRFRIINESARNVFTRSVDGHNLTIIEADGVATTPLTVDEVEMLAGQRYSFVLEANQPVDNYWFNAPFVGGDPTRNLNRQYYFNDFSSPFRHTYLNRDFFLAENATLSRGILRYQGAQDADPTGPMTLGPTDGTPIVEANLRPLVREPAPETDINITLNLVLNSDAHLVETIGQSKTKSSGHCHDFMTLRLSLMFLHHYPGPDEPAYLLPSPPYVGSNISLSQSGGASTFLTQEQAGLEFGPLVAAFCNGSREERLQCLQTRRSLRGLTSSTAPKPNDFAYNSLVQDLRTSFARTHKPNPSLELLKVRGRDYASTIA
ncbi:Cu-oxidase-domain-containing protein [Dendrothele bispora CBS 962.96]|uniref:Cu-oxidase-domain-containing protein n=1 Tax=Dendrothele bispora (strain CBS 962.96) TaxID=1314807 RepID=A0A4S8KRF2_DENBC|nr:Cu-oxidase-domain-containing protein [Dendrothele bispora CBS 962.96]